METVRNPAEGRVILPNVSWQTYERLIEECEERRNPRFYYDRGVMEIVSPSKRHEEIAYIAGDLVGLLAMEMDLDLLGAGSTTFKRETFELGSEPDECFYFGGNIEAVRGKDDLDLDAGDPPPDLVIEVDVTNPTLDKLGIYARLGVREAWRFSGGRAEIFVLGGEGYESVETSLAFPALAADVLFRFVERGLETSRPEWTREVREWVSRKA